MESLGIDLKIIGFQILNFGVLVFVLNKFLYKPVLKAINAKKQEVDEINKSKEQIVVDSEKSQEAQALLMKSAQTEKAQVLKDAKLEADKIKKAAREEAEKKILALVEKAKKDLEAEKKKLVHDFDAEVLSAAFAVNEKILADLSDKKAVEEAYKKLGLVKSVMFRN